MFSVPPLTPFVKKLIITLFASYVIELILLNFVHFDVLSIFALDPNHLGPLTPLQLVSYVLMEDPQYATAFLISLLFMWLILSPFEANFGARRLIQLSLCGTLAASVAAIAAANLLPGATGLFVGSSPIAYAGMSATTQIMRGGRMLFFGAIPMTTRQLLLLLVVLCFLDFLVSRDHVRLAGSLAAIAAGIGYVRFISRPSRPSRPSRSSAPRFRVLRGGGSSSASEGDRPKWLN